MGSCFGTLFDVTLGTCRGRRGRQRQRLAERGAAARLGMGAAVMTTVYFKLLGSAGQAHAVVVSLIVAGAVMRSASGSSGCCRAPQPSHEGAPDAGAEPDAYADAERLVPHEGELAVAHPERP